MRLLPVALLTAGFIAAAGPIITRHDVSDHAYKDLANELPVTPAVVRYNATDVAGTFIARDWLLSAAHVAETIEPGTFLFTSHGDLIEVEEVVLHPGWIKDGRPEDFALIRLRQPVDNVPLVAIYDGRDEMGMTVTVVGNGDVGMGLTGPVGNDGHMRAATNRVDEATEQYLIWSFDEPGSGFDRATPFEGVSGPGDSGGPAFVHVGDSYYVAGVSSGQRTRASGGDEGRYGVTEYYTRVSTYKAWIDATLFR